MKIWEKFKKREWLSLAFITLVIAWFALPSGDPTDVLITLPLIAFLGWKQYLVVAGIVLLAAIYFNGRLLKKWFKKKR